MAKSEKYENIELARRENYLRGEKWHDAAIISKHDLGIATKKQPYVDEYYKLAIKYFWRALILGCDKAPFYLFDCLLMSGSSVAKDKDIMVLMYGAALQLTEKKCKKKFQKKTDQ